MYVFVNVDLINYLSCLYNTIIIITADYRGQSVLSLGETFNTKFSHWGGGGYNTLFCLRKLYGSSQQNTILFIPQITSKLILFSNVNKIWTSSLITILCRSWINAWLRQSIWLFSLIFNMQWNAYLELMASWGGLYCNEHPGLHSRPNSTLYTVIKSWCHF